MPENIYEIISLGARYWFAFLGLLIVWRSFSWLRKDRRAKHRRLKHLPDAGMIGEMVVLQGSDDLPEGTAIPVPRAGVLGFLRTCDVVVPVDGVAGKHIDFSFQDGKGLLLFPLRGQSCLVDDTELTHRSKTKKHPMCHGSRLEVGDAVLRLRLFAGLDTEYRPLYADEQAYRLPFQDDVTSDWQDAAYIYHQEPAPWAEQQNPWLQEEQAYFDEQSCFEEQPQQDSWIQPPVYPPYQQSYQQQPYPQQGYGQPYQQPYQQPWPQQEEPFEPAQARQKQSRFRRRRSHEE